jgi:hypothetical protein
MNPRRGPLPHRLHRRARETEISELKAEHFRLMNGGIDDAVARRIAEIDRRLRELGEMPD